MPLEVDTIVDEGIDDVSMFWEANSDGGAERRGAFQLLEVKIVGPVRLNHMRYVFANGRRCGCCPAGSVGLLALLSA